MPVLRRAARDPEQAARHQREAKIADIGDERYKSSPHFTDAEKALMDLTVQIGVDANRIPKMLGTVCTRISARRRSSRPSLTITTYHRDQQVLRRRTGVALEPVFTGIEPLLHVHH